MNVRSVLLAILMAMLIPVTGIQQALSPWMPVGRGITYREFALSGPNRAFVARMDRQNPTITIESSLASGAFGKGFETVGQMVNRYDQSLNFWRDLDDASQFSWGKRSKVVVAINGSYLEQDNRALPQNGMVQSGWYTKRFNDNFGWSGFAWKLNGESFIGDCVFHRGDRQTITFPNGTIEDLDGINLANFEAGIIAYTAQFGGRTPEGDMRLEIELELDRPFGLTRSDQPVQAKVLRVGGTQGNTPILFDRLVLVARGSVADRIAPLLQPGALLTLHQQIEHYPKCDSSGGSALADWSGVYTSIGGAHTFLRDGEVVPHAEDDKRHPRTAIAYDENYIYFIVVDGRDPERSIGMTIPELGEFARDTLGAQWGIAQDGGGSSTMIVNGTVVNNPSDVCYEYQTYLPAISQDYEYGSVQPRALPSLLTSEMQPGHCLRPVANGLMMVEVEPRAQSTNWTAGQAVLTTEEVNLRAGPGINYPVLARMPLGANGQVVEHANGLNGIFASGYTWWMVEFDGVQGWMAAEFLRAQ